jgi:hypothetical protein
MKKKKLLVIVLIIGMLFGTYTFIKSMIERKNADETFVYCISQASGSFAVDYNRMNDNEKNYYLERYFIQVLILKIKIIGMSFIKWQMI